MQGISVEVMRGELARTAKGGRARISTSNTLIAKALTHAEVSVDQARCGCVCVCA